MNLLVIYQLDLYSCHSGFNDNGAHSLRYMNSWFPVGEPTWEILGEVVLEEMCQWEWAYRLQKSMSFPNGSLVVVFCLY